MLIVGGGPAGSSAAWGLCDSDLDVIVLDRKEFPRNKICAGWVTPQILAELDISEEEYRASVPVWSGSGDFMPERTVVFAFSDETINGRWSLEIENLGDTPVTLEGWTLDVTSRWD